MNAIRTYTDLLGRTHKAVDGPNGTYLITRTNEGDRYEVWKSDQLNAQGRYRDPTTALERACQLAGLDL